MQVFPVTDKEKLDLDLLTDLLVKMLHLEPAKRITPQKILKHGFVTSLAAFITGWVNAVAAKWTTISQGVGYLFSCSVRKSSVMKTTRKSFHQPGKPAKKSPDPQRLATEVQSKPPKMKRKGEDEDLRVSKRVKIPISGSTAEDGEKEQKREIKTSPARGRTRASTKRHALWWRNDDVGFYEVEAEEFSSVVLLFSRQNGWNVFLLLLCIFIYYYLTLHYEL